MKINRKDNLTLQIYDLYFPSDRAKDGAWTGAPSPDTWWAMMEWARMNCIVCRRGRGTDLIFEREEDITAFVLRWS